MKSVIVQECQIIRQRDAILCAYKGQLKSLFPIDIHISNGSYHQYRKLAADQYWDGKRTFRFQGKIKIVEIVPDYKPQ